MKATVNGLTGLIMCGGSSTRMGTDKCLLEYHNKPQCYHLHDMLARLCKTSFLSCSIRQAGMIDKKYNVLTDLRGYEPIGPMAGLLTALHHFPESDFLVIGCDYPLLTEKDLVDFLYQCQRTGLAAAFYNDSAGVYEPLLAWYSHRSADPLSERFRKGQYSLQHFLREIDAEKYKPLDVSVLTSIDTPEGMRLTKSILNHN